MNPLCDATTFLNCFDKRRVRELLSDSGTPLDGDYSANEVLVQLLHEASDVLRSAVQLRGKYSNAELYALSQSTAQGFLVRRLVADLAFGLLNMRRGVSQQSVAQTSPGWLQAQQMLAQLRDGQMIFPVYVEETIDGYVMDLEVHQSTGRPGVADLSYENNPGSGFRSISDRTYGRLFPRRDCE